MSTILLLHGALGSASQFDSFSHKLNESFTCHAIDFPLHGQNKTQTAFSIQNFADYLIAYIEQHHQEKVSVFGYSMGGYVAIYAASLRPDLFDGIMTLATKFKWDEEIACKEKAMLNTDEMEHKIPAFVAQLQERHKHIEWKDLIHQTTLLLEGLGNMNLLSTECLQAIPMRIRVGIGDKDAMVSLDEAIDTFRQLKLGSLYVLPNTKHPFEKVDEEMLLCQFKSFFS